MTRNILELSRMCCALISLSTIDTRKPIEMRAHVEVTPQHHKLAPEYLSPTHLEMKVPHGVLTLSGVERVRLTWTHFVRKYALQGVPFQRSALALTRYYYGLVDAGSYRSVGPVLPGDAFLGKIDVEVPARPDRIGKWGRIARIWPV